MTRATVLVVSPYGGHEHFKASISAVLRWLRWRPGVALLGCALASGNCSSSSSSTRESEPSGSTGSSRPASARGSESSTTMTSYGQWRGTVAASSRAWTSDSHGDP